MIHNKVTKEVSITRLVTFVGTLATVVTLIIGGLGYAVGTGRILGKIDTTAHAAETNTGDVTELKIKQASTEATINAVASDVKDIKQSLHELNGKVDVLARRK